MKRFRMVALTLALVCFGFATAFAGDPIGRPDTPPLSKKVDGFSFVVDTSGSMMMKSPVYDEKKIVLAKDLLGALNARIPSLDFTSALYTFSPVTTPVSAGAWDRQAYGKAITAIPANLGIFDRLTDLGGDMQKIAPMFASSATEAVILVTDGWDNIGPEAVETVRNILSARPNVRLHIISFADTKPGKASIAKLAALSSDTVCVNGADLLTDPVAMDQFIKAVLYVEERYDGLLSVYFATASHELSAEAKATLDKAASYILNVPHGVRNVEVEGFTDKTGGWYRNDTLSERRAAAVKDYLVSKGVPAGKVYTCGNSVSFKYNNNTVDGRRQNRRADIIIN